MDVNPHGVERINFSDKISVKPHTIYLTSNKPEVLEQRIRSTCMISLFIVLARGTEEVLNEKITTSKESIKRKPDQFEVVIVNDNINATYPHIKKQLIEWYPSLEYANQK